MQQKNNNSNPINKESNPINNSSSPIDNVNIKLKDSFKKLNVSKLTPPYNYESRAIEASGECSKSGPRVWIMTHTQDIIRTLFTAIRTCYSPFDQAYIAYNEYFDFIEMNESDTEFPNEAINLIAKVAKINHLSTLEHVNFTFGIRCVSRATLSHFTRHRVGFSFSVQSQRYVSQSSDSLHGEFNYVIPESIQNTECEQTYIKAIEAAQKSYNQMIKCGIPPEDARYVFPNSVTTNITVTCNLRAFLDFYSKRNPETGSQWEIQLLAERMKEEIIKVEPQLEFLFEIE